MKALQFNTDIKKGRKEPRKNQRQKYAVRFEALEILSQARRDAELCPSVTEILKQNLFAKVEKKSKKQTVMKQTQKSLVDRLKAFSAAKKNERRIENLIESNQESSLRLSLRWYIDARTDSDFKERSRDSHLYSRADVWHAGYE